MIAFWLPFGTLLAPFGCFWEPSVPFLLPLGAFSQSFAPPVTLSVRPGVLLVHFGCPFGHGWGSNGSPNAAKATRVVTKGSKNHLPHWFDFWLHSGMFSISFRGSRVDSGFHLSVPHQNGTCILNSAYFPSAFSYLLLQSPVKGRRPKAARVLIHD